MSDLPLHLPDGAAAALLPALDRERKIDRALEALGPVIARDVLVVGGGPNEIGRLEAAGARVVPIDDVPSEASRSRPAASVDAIVSAWAAFRGVEPAALAEADRLLRPDGRLLVIHDYGRDDVSRLRGDLPEYGAWSRRDGPYLANGFRMRVLHCFWTWDSMEEARDFLSAAFGPEGVAFGEGLKRPRLSWNVAVYHRSRGGKDADEPPVAGGASS